MRLLSLFLLSFFAFVPAYADVDEGLYDPVAPEGSAFVRFFNGVEGDNKVNTKAKGKIYDEIGFLDNTAYFVVPEGEVTLSMNGQESVTTIEAGKFYTVAFIKAEEAPLILEDQANTNRAKAQISLYNLDSEHSFNLKAKEGKVAVIENVEYGQSGSRELNPLKVDFSIFAGEQEKIALEPVVLERGMAYSIFYAAGKTAFVTAETDTTR